MSQEEKRVIASKFITEKPKFQIIYEIELINADIMSKSYKNVSHNPKHANHENFMSDAIKYAKETNIIMNEYKNLDPATQIIITGNIYGKIQQVATNYNNNIQSQSTKMMNENGNQSGRERMKNTNNNNNDNTNDNNNDNNDTEMKDSNKMGNSEKNNISDDEEDDDGDIAADMAAKQLSQKLVIITYIKQLPNMIQLLTPNAKIKDERFKQFANPLNDNMINDQINTWENDNGPICWSKMNISNQYEICNKMQQTISNNNNQSPILNTLAVESKYYGYIRPEKNDHMITLSLKNKQMEQLDANWELKLQEELMNIQYLLHPFEVIVINRKKPNKKDNKTEYIAASLTQIPSIVTMDDDGNLLDIKEIEKNILVGIENGCDAIKADDVARIIFYQVNDKRRIDNLNIKHRAKLLLKNHVKYDDIIDKIVKFGLEEAQLTVFKTDAHRRAEKYHPIMGVLNMCSYCSRIGHTKMRCIAYLNEIEQMSQNLRIQSYTELEIKEEIRNSRIIPICHNCNDVNNPHYSKYCRNDMYCGRCGGKDHTVKDLIKCPKIAKENYENVIFLINHYGNDWKKQIYDIIGKYPNGISRYIRNKQPIRQSVNKEDEQEQRRCNFDTIEKQLNECANQRKENNANENDEEDENDEKAANLNSRDDVTVGMRNIERTMPPEMRMPQSKRNERKRTQSQLESPIDLTQSEADMYHTQQATKKRRINGNYNNYNNNSNSNSRGSSISNIRKRLSYTMNENRYMNSNIPRMSGNNHLNQQRMIIMNGKVIQAQSNNYDVNNTKMMQNNKHNDKS